MAFPFTALFIIIILALFFRYRYIKKKTQERDDNFWEKERLANASVGKDPSTFPYAAVSPDKFPLPILESLGVDDISNRLNTISSQKLMKVWHMSNTDVKLAYGVTNFDYVSECGDNFSEYMALILECATALYESNHISEATALLEHGLALGTDLSRSYTLLADIYASANQTAKLNMLLDLSSKAPELWQPKIKSYVESKLA